MQSFYILKDVFSILFTFVHFEDFLITKDINYSKVQLVAKHWPVFRALSQTSEMGPCSGASWQRTLCCISPGSMSEFSSLAQSHRWPLYIHL